MAANTAPTLTPRTPGIGQVNEDDTGFTWAVADFLGLSLIADPDAGALAGMAVSANGEGSGSWTYSLGDGVWHAVGDVDAASALLLRPQDQLRYTGDGVTGGYTATLRFHAWDQTQGSAGERVDIGTGGGESAFSEAAETLSLGVTELDDPPQGVLRVAAPGGFVQGQVLTATPDFTDADGIGEPLRYEWLRDGIVIDGAQAASYTLTQADVDHVLSVRVRYTDTRGYAGEVLGDLFNPVANLNDAPQGDVTFSGVAMAGQSFYATHTLTDADGLGEISYQWLRDGTAIDGATFSAYSLTKEDENHHISLRASYVDGYGQAESKLSSATFVPNVNDPPLGTVTVGGTAMQGETLTVQHLLSDLDGVGELAFEWLRDGTQVVGTGQSYALGQADVGHFLVARVRYVDGNGTAERVDSEASATVADANVAPQGEVTIEGDAVQGEYLFAANSLSDGDGMGPVAYVWLRNGEAIEDADGASYRLTQADVGQHISVRAEYVDGDGEPQARVSAPTASVADVDDAPTGSVGIAGLAREDVTLQAAVTLDDPDGLGALNYQWLRDGAAIEGAALSSYTLEQADVGHRISLRVSYVDGGGFATELAPSAPTDIVANVNDDPQGAIEILGTAQVGRTVRVVNDQVSDADGIDDVAFQWLRDGVEIAEATGREYLLAEADLGAAITVRMDYIDGHGTAESLLSEAVVPRSGPPANPPGSPPQPQGVTLTAPEGGGELTGTAYGDMLSGRGGRDTFHPLAGRDTVDGGGGVDTVVFTGLRGDWDIVRQDDGSLTVHSKADAGTVATLHGIERLQFGDQTLAVDLTHDLAEVARLYHAALGRAPEEGGLAYYADALAQGATLLQIATGFLASPEFAAQYGGTGDAEFLTRLYANAFGREPDAAGLAFQLDVLAHEPGLAGRAQMLASFIEAPETQVMLAGLVAQGVALLEG